MGDVVNPQNTTTDIATIVDTAKDTLVEKFDTSLEYADNALKEAMAFLGRLESAASGFPFFIPDIESQFPAPKSYDFNPGDPPVAPAVDLPMPAFPSAPILGTVALLTGIQAKLEADLAAGGTGLPAATEALIWAREQERARLAHEEAQEKIAAEWSKRGFDLPDGVLVANLTQSEIDYKNKRLDLSRDIAIKQVELAYDYGKFIVQQVLTLENLMVTAVVEGNKTLMDQFKANIEAYRALIQAAIEKLGAHIKVYETGGRVYESKAKAQAAIAEVDVKAAEATLNAAISQMHLYLKQAELAMKNSEVAAQLKVQAAQGGAHIAAQLAAGIFSGVSVQAHLSAGATVHKGYSGQESVSESYPHKERD
jgi:hypothetical protein